MRFYALQFYAFCLATLFSAEVFAGGPCPSTSDEHKKPDDWMGPVFQFIQVYPDANAGAGNDAVGLDQSQNEAARLHESGARLCAARHQSRKRYASGLVPCTVAALRMHGERIHSWFDHGASGAAE